MGRMGDWFSRVWRFVLTPRGIRELEDQVAEGTVPIGPPPPPANPEARTDDIQEVRRRLDLVEQRRLAEAEAMERLFRRQRTQREERAR